MSGSKTKEVGGGPAVGLANDYTTFLSHGLGSGKFGSGAGSSGVGSRGNDVYFDRSVPGRSGGSSGDGGFGDYINQIISGGGPVTDTSALKDMAKGGGYAFKDLPGAGVDWSKFNGSQGLRDAAGKEFDPNITTNPLFSDARNAFGGITGAAVDMSGINEKNFRASDINGPGAAAAEAMLAREQARGQKELRSRYGARGGLGFGSPAAYAEGNFLAESGAQNAAKIADIMRSDAALKLQKELGEGNINADQYKTYMDALIRGKIATASNQTSASIAKGQGLGDMISRALGQEGQLRLGARGQNLDALLGAGNLDLGAMKGASDYDIGRGTLFNQDQATRASNQSQNRGLDIEALSKALGFDESGRQANAGNQLNMIQSILSQLGLISGKGISQRQVVQQPGGFQNIMGGITGILGGLSGLSGIKNLFGGGSPGGQPGGPSLPGYDPNDPGSWGA